MRTSTVVFLVLFLCLFSSQERRSKFRSVVEDVKAHIHDATRDHIDHGCSDRPRRSRDSRGGDVVRSEEARALKDGIRLLDEKDEAAQRTLRTIDRSLRTLDDRIHKLERESAREPHLQDVYHRSLELLVRQRVELQQERDELVRLKERMEGEKVRLRAELDLAKIRAERREVEAFLDRERSSPMDELAAEEGQVGF